MVGVFRNGIARVGGLPLGGDETELWIRAAGRWPRKIFLCEPRARIHHRISLYRASWRYFRLRCYAEGLSKAIVAKYVGAKDSLSTERIYTWHTMTQHIMHGRTD